MIAEPSALEACSHCLASTPPAVRHGHPPVLEMVAADWADWVVEILVEDHKATVHNIRRTPAMLPVAGVQALVVEVP